MIKEYLQYHPYRYKNFIRKFMDLFSYTPKEEIMNKAMRYCRQNSLSGDYFEFGTYVGNSFICAYHLAKLNNVKIKKYYAFDSFKGLPELKDEIDKKTTFKKGQYAFSEQDFRNRLHKKKVDLNDVRIIRGFYKDSLKHLRLDCKASVIMIDSDLYSSAIYVLNFIRPYLQEGTLLIFDDYFYGGERKALKEWLELNPKFEVEQYHKYDSAGNSFIIHINKEKQK